MFIHNLLRTYILYNEVPVLEIVNYSFVIITPRSTLARSDIIYQSLIYGQIDLLNNYSYPIRILYI